QTATIVAPVTDPRIDRIVLVADPDDGSYGQVEVVEGTEDAAPVAPDVPEGRLPLARLSLSSGQTAIESGHITDERGVKFLSQGGDIGDQAEIEAETAGALLDAANAKYHPLMTKCLLKMTVAGAI